MRRREREEIETEKREREEIEKRQRREKRRRKVKHKQSSKKRWMPFQKGERIKPLEKRTGSEAKGRMEEE